LETLRPVLVPNLAHRPADELNAKRSQSAIFKSDLTGSSNGAAAAEESLILDARGELSPAQMVETKLMSLLRARGSLVNHIQMATVVKARSINEDCRGKS
jgi:hypothetical protein